MERITVQGVELELTAEEARSLAEAGRRSASNIDKRLMQALLRGYDKANRVVADMDETTLERPDAVAIGVGPE